MIYELAGDPRSQQAGQPNSEGEAPSEPARPPRLSRSFALPKKQGRRTWEGEAPSEPPRPWAAPHFLVHLIRETTMSIQIGLLLYHLVRRWVLLRSQAALNSFGVA